MAGNEGAAKDERLLVIASRMFSDLGYDSVDTEMIAKASGIGADTLTGTFGGKRGIYIAAFEWASKKSLDHMKVTVDEISPGAEGIMRSLDEYLDFSVSHPEIAGLWMQRWMSDASDLPGMERAGGPVFGQWAAKMNSSIPADMDPAMTLRMFVWMIHAFVRGGLVGDDGKRRTADDRETLQQLRDHIHRTVRHLAV